mgnify:FL=1|jgi:hypothetical protein
MKIVDPITDEELMAYVDDELTDQPDLRDHITSNLDEYRQRMAPFVFTRRLMNLLREK